MLLATAGALLAAAPAAATSPAPKHCGETPNKRYAVRVDQASACSFGMATYRSIVDYDRRAGFVAAVSKNFTLRVTDSGRTVTMDCRANARAHGEFDFACNNLNRGGRRVVKLDTLMLP
jgi:hypothetical protein